MIHSNPFEKKLILRSHLAPLQKILIATSRLKEKIFFDPLFRKAKLVKAAGVRLMQSIECLQNILAVNSFIEIRSLNNRAQETK